MMQKELGHYHLPLSNKMCTNTHTHTHTGVDSETCAQIWPG